jgi:8-oxo-dGTP pyrophosphatase MutT (NUDIX family)
MNGFVVHDLHPDATVGVVRAMPPLAPALDAEVERLWRIASERVWDGGAGRLFNGLVFSIDCIEPHAITGHLTEYRRLVAQMEDHGLFPALCIRSLSTCGVLRCAGGVAFGRRPAAAIYQPGMWQMPPAGSVDSHAVGADGSVDLAEQMLRELEEELGLDPGCVGRPVPLCVVEHDGSHVSDCGMAIGTVLTANDVLAAHRARGNSEYAALRIVPEADLSAFVAWAGAALVPPAREFLFRLGLLDQGLSPPTAP